MPHESPAPHHGDAHHPESHRYARPAGFGAPRAGPRPLARASLPAGGRAVHSIGELSREFGVSLRTLRFYEDKGLLAPVRRGTARLYGPQDRGRLAMILKGKALGFTLREIRAMVAEDEAGPPAAGAGAPGPELALTPDQVLGQIIQLEQRKAEIEEALARLRGLRGA